MALYDTLDDDDLVEQLRKAADWLTIDAAHQPDRADYVKVGRFADVCRLAAVRIEQLILMLQQQNGAKVEPSGADQPRLQLADDDE
jgi:hypothetical protein